MFLMLCFNFSFSQVYQGTKVGTKVNVTNKTVNERELVLTEPKTEIRVPLEVDLYNYTHLVLVEINSISGNPKRYGGREMSTYNLYEDRLSSSPLKIINPVKVSKKKWKKDPLFLRDEVKDPKHVYLYYLRKEGSGNDDITTTVILRDYQNKVIYSSIHYNVGIPEILYPLIGF